MADKSRNEPVLGWIVLFYRKMYMKTMPKDVKVVLLRTVYAVKQTVGYLKLKHILFATCLATFLLICTYFGRKGDHEEPEMVCYEDYYASREGLVVCRPRCKKGYFSLPWMDTCHKALTCRDIHSEKFKVIEHLGNGAVKSAHLADWEGHRVVLNSLINKHVGEDFKQGLAMLTLFNGSPYTTQLLGYCKHSFVTEYHPFGSANNFENIVQNYEYSYLKRSVKARFGLCINYVQILNYLHTQPEGAYVMCDSNSLEKTLQQCLIRSDFQLLANDLDAIPVANKALNKTITCGHRVLHGDFVAPEQKWPYSTDFDDSVMPGYTEKVDIYKIPDVCEYFISQDTTGLEPLRFHLFKIHQRCKAVAPEKRPNAGEVLQEYKRVYGLL